MNPQRWCPSMDFNGWVPPEIKIGAGVILALLGVIAFLLMR